MSDPSMIHAARQLATRAHRGQTDKAGADYIDHPRRVASGALAHADPAWQAETVAATIATLSLRNRRQNSCSGERAVTC